eukprot:TRINITY_DN81560_c0_g1_i1.p1 TRINITY_DN81560_c0_g1~~TRINITY_DN81560_c0_g1_i1.p1  ORF type:complete len:233 (+),score=34.08 TRINITY_DN81560_c0_g1_i1:161-859(+)
MVERHLILVDDSDQSQTLRNLKRKLKNDDGIDLNYIQINSKDAKFQQYDESTDSQRTNVNSIVDEICAVSFFKSADTIALDYNLSDELKGFELAGLIRKKGYKKTKNIILYSGKIEDAINVILEKETLEEKRKAIKSLTQSNIHFASRGDDFTSSVIEHIKENPQFDFDYELLKWLDKFKERKFVGNFPDYSDKLLEEIAQEIEDNTNLSQSFRRALVEQIFSLLVEINELG